MTLLGAMAVSGAYQEDSALPPRTASEQHLA